jgi:hypothetical protein
MLSMLYTLFALCWFIMDNLFRTWNYLPSPLALFARVLRKIPVCFIYFYKFAKINLRFKKSQINSPDVTKTDSNTTKQEVGSEKNINNHKNDLDVNLIALNRFLLFLLTFIVAFCNSLMWLVVAFKPN